MVTELSSSVPAYSSAASAAADLPMGMRCSPASSRSSSSSTDRAASCWKALALLVATVPFISITRRTRAAFPAEMPLSKVSYSGADVPASWAITWLNTDVPGAWLWSTPSTEATSSRWSRAARAWSLSSTEIRMAEEMLSM